MLERLETCSPVIPLFSPYKNARPLSCFIQNAVRTGAISQIQPDGQLPLENVFCIRPHSVILLHCRSPFLCLEHVEHWERIASRGRPAFSSHLVNAAEIGNLEF